MEFLKFLGKIAITGFMTFSLLVTLYAIAVVALEGPALSSVAMIINLSTISILLGLVVHLFGGFEISRKEDE